MHKFGRLGVALAIAGAVLGAMPAQAQHEFSGKYIKVTVTECWSIPFTSYNVCRTREVWVAEHLMDEVMSGELIP